MEGYDYNNPYSKFIPGFPVEDDLIEQRKRFADELDNPGVRQAFNERIANEVGGMSPAERQSYVESTMNRAHARNMSLLETVNDRGYFPKSSFRRRRNANFDENISNALSGSNVSNRATGNESGNVHSDGAIVTMRGKDGERFVIENPDVAEHYGRHVPKGEPVEEENPYMKHVPQASPLADLNQPPALPPPERVPNEDDFASRYGSPSAAELNEMGGAATTPGSPADKFAKAVLKTGKAMIPHEAYPSDITSGITQALPVPLQHAIQGTQLGMRWAEALKKPWGDQSQYDIATETAAVGLPFVLPFVPKAMRSFKKTPKAEPRLPEAPPPLPPEYAERRFVMKDEPQPTLEPGPTDIVKQVEEHLRAKSQPTAREQIVKQDYDVDARTLIEEAKKVATPEELRKAADNWLRSQGADPAEVADPMVKAMSLEQGAREILKSRPPRPYGPRVSPETGQAFYPESDVRTNTPSETARFNPDRPVAGRPIVAEVPPLEVGPKPEVVGPETVPTVAAAPKPIQTRKADLPARRVAHDVDPVDTELRKTWKREVEEADAQMAGDPMLPERLAREVADKPRPTSTQENVHLVRNMLNREKALDNAAEAVSRGEEGANLRFEEARQSTKEAYDALDKSHTAHGRAFNALKMAFDRFGNLERMKHIYKAAKGGKKDLTPAEVVEVTKTHQKMVRYREGMQEGGGLRADHVEFSQNVAQSLSKIKKTGVKGMSKFKEFMAGEETAALNAIKRERGTTKWSKDFDPCA